MFGLFKHNSKKNYQRWDEAIHSDSQAANKALNPISLSQKWFGRAGVNKKRQARGIKSLLLLILSWILSMLPKESRNISIRSTKIKIQQ